MKGRNYVCQALIESKIIAKNKNQKEIKFEKKIGSLTKSFHGSCDFKQFRRGKPMIGMGGVAMRKNIFDNKLYKVRLRKYSACGIVLLPISLFF